MNEEDRKYFEEIRETKIPSIKPGQSEDSYTNMCHLYISLRHLATEALRNGTDVTVLRSNIEVILKKIEQS